MPRVALRSIKESGMAETQMRSMTPEEFYEWQFDQDELYELVEGVPVPLRAMTGASNVHDAILVNCIGELGSYVRGRPCRVASADTALRTAPRTARRPDVSVDCAPPRAESYEAHRPTAVSKSSRLRHARSIASPNSRNTAAIRACAISC
jgi:Uma2 family endonuclease